MATNMAYMTIIAILFGVFALAGERVVAELRQPRRFVWLAAIVATLLVPLSLLYVQTRSAAQSIVSLPFDIELLPVALPNSLRAAVEDTLTSPWPTLPGPDTALLMLWIAASTIMIAACGLSWHRLARELRTAERVNVTGQEIAVSRNLGPAVFGLLSPQIIMPRWLTSEHRRLMPLVIRHERAHIEAKDHLLILLALLLVALMPWNPVLWLQMRKLRAATEIDCDDRVLRSGANKTQYSEALLCVRQHHAVVPFGAAALGEPVSELERRIQIMLQETHRFRPAHIALFSSLAGIALTVALAINAPHAQETEIETVSSKHAMSEEIYSLLTQAQSCMENEDPECADAILDDVGARDLNSYETMQYWNFRAFAAYSQDDIAGATAMYENVLRSNSDGLPEPMRQQTLFTLAQLYLSTEQYEQSLDMLDQWFAAARDAGTEPSAQTFYLRAVIQHRLERTEDALQSLILAINETSEPEENFYELQLALYHETDNDSGIIETLEILNELWPSTEREILLTRMKGISG